MQDLIRHLPAVLFEYAIHPDGDERFNFVSETSAGFLGLTPEALRQDHTLLYAIVHEEDLPFLKQEMDRTGAGKRTCYWKGRVAVGKEIKWIELRSNDEVTGEGIILRRGIIQDAAPFTTEKAVEQVRGYQGLLEKLPIGVVIHCQGKVMFANTQAHHIIGANNPKMLIGMKAIDFVHPDHIDGITRRIKKVSEGDAVPMVEEKFVRFDGKTIDVETMAFPFIYKGKPAIQVIFRDITEKKHTEARFRRDEILFTQLFQNVPLAVVMLNGRGQVIEINKGFAQMFGYEENELRGKNLNDFIVPEHLENEGIDLNKLIAAKQVVNIESIRRHRSGKLVNVILCGVPVMLDDQIIAIYGVYVDISDRKKVEEELKIRNTELDNFVYKVSHDLRAPLSSVLGLVNLSRLQGNTDNPLEYIGIIGDKIEALDHFIGDVLSHSKNLKMEINICKVDLRNIIEQTFTDLGYLNGAQEMKRPVKIKGIDFYSDHWRVSEVFRNLISNAIKYRRPDSKESEISITINVDHLYADIVFEDNGIGIKETSLQRIFEMFYRATQQSDGSGIGLYIVKNAIEKLGGQIDVASTLDHGTRFHIVLPNRINGALKIPSLLQNNDENC